MWYNFFIIGGIWFWLLFALEMCSLFYYTYNEDTAESCISFVIFLAIIHLFGDASLFTYIQNNSMDTLRYISLYLGIGVGFYFFYSAYKMFTFKMYARELKEKWGKITNTDESWEKYFSAAVSVKERKKASLDYYKERAPLWIIWWPVVSITALLGDFLVNCVKYTYTLFFERIIKKMHGAILGNSIPPEDPMSKRW